jgi:hypothetical protein
MPYYILDGENAGFYPGTNMWPEIEYEDMPETDENNNNTQDDLVNSNSVVNI